MLDPDRPASKLPSKVIWLMAGIVTALVIILVVLFVFRPSPAAHNQTTTQRILDRVNTIYLLPTGEEPTVARIQDAGKLTGQVFYKDAQDGDYLILYNQSKLALIYRESDHRLINVAPVASPAPAN